MTKEIRNTNNLLLQVCLRRIGLIALALIVSSCSDDGGVDAPDAGIDAPPAPVSYLLVGNSVGDNIVRFDQATGEFVDDFIPAGTLDHPDWMEIRGNFLYVANGDLIEDSGIMRFDAQTGEFIDTFAAGGGLHRPYGFAFGDDGYIYVASFLTDEILRYEATTGDYVDVFASGDGTPGTVNGPDGLVFGPDGMLYVTTQGSVAVDGAPTFPGLPSEVLRYDVSTGQSEVFVTNVMPMDDSAGYVSLLGSVFGPDCAGGTCDLFVSDFANGIRRYDENGTLVDEVSTSYTGMPTMNATGSLAFGDDGMLFTVVFDSSEGSGERGAILRHDGASGNPMPSSGNPGSIFTPTNDRLTRPIGIIAVPAE